MAFHKSTDRACKSHHEDDRDYDRSDHDSYVVYHSHCRDNRVEREDHIEHKDLNNNAGERRSHTRGRVSFLAFEFSMDLKSALTKQKQSTHDQNQVTAGDFLT